MNICIYAKNIEDINVFDVIVNLIKGSNDEIYISVENKRCFRELEHLKSICNCDDIIVVSNLSSLGINDTDIANQLEWFVAESKKLVICSIPTTYEYGVSQPMNKAVLTTILQSLVYNKQNIIKMPQNKRSNSGRNRIEFPDNWDDLYAKWTSKKITSKEFLALTGLKKATFYNLLTEYKKLQELNEQYIKKYKTV